jgi:hypothetical protein
MLWRSDIGLHDVITTDERDLEVVVAYLKVQCRYWSRGLRWKQEVRHDGEEIRTKFFPEYKSAMLEPTPPLCIETGIITSSSSIITSSRRMSRV